ncbi:MAG TPA: dihydrolipoamide acetyltransferase family protein [Nitrospirales bacterium]|nr:dihydrolipoamide acetyltransferase family protein [Nitrospirales bacterium]
MASRVIMPKLTDSMEEGVVVKWRKAEGERVESGDALAEIETDKAVMDLEAFASGTLLKILVPEGTTVPSGTLIGVIGEPDEDIQALIKESPAATPSEQPRPSPVSPASPRVRTLAREHGIDLKAIKGSGSGGRIVERDLEPFLAKKKEQPAVREVPLSQMRKAIVRMTTQSKAPVPHFYVTIDVDMAEGLRVVEESKKAAAPSPISINHLLIAASARALKQHPGLNASFAGETIRIFSSIDIGIAVALEDGLIVPVLRDCGSKTLGQIVEAERVLVARARKRELAPEEYTGATFLISNLGKFDVESFSAVILPPAAAALAVGSVREVPVVQDGRVEVGHRMTLTLSCDHRVIDGTVAAQFLQTFKQALVRARDL